MEGGRVEMRCGIDSLVSAHVRVVPSMERPQRQTLVFVCDPLFALPLGMMGSVAQRGLVHHKERDKHCGCCHQPSALTAYPATLSPFRSVCGRTAKRWISCGVANGCSARRWRRRAGRSSCHATCADVLSLVSLLVQIKRCRLLSSCEWME